MRKMQKTTVLICVIASLRVFGEWLGDDAIMSAAARWLAEDRIAQMTMVGLSPESVAARGALRIVSLSPAGYIVFSGSDLSDPVISFSRDAYIEPEQGSPFYDMLAFSGKNVAKRDAEGGERNAKWTSLIEGRDGSKPIARRRLTSSPDEDPSIILIAPFMTTLWNQGAPWNDFCPLDDTTNRCPCGCVATATAQQIAYNRWPWRTGRQDTWVHTLDTDGKPDVQDGPYADTEVIVRFDGHEPFEWESFLDEYDGYWGDPRGRKQESERFAIARFVSWIDLITRMNFGKGGSGANFGNTGDSTTDWYEAWEICDLENENPEGIAKIKADFEFGVPVHVGVPGHSVIGHGLAYDKETGAYYLYLNYGWGGSADGWYELFSESSPIGGAFTGFRPKKMVQLEPLPKVSGGDVEVKWHLPQCYDDEVLGFAVKAVSFGDVIDDDICNFSTSSGVASNIHGTFVTNGVVGVENDTDLLWWDPCETGTYDIPGERMLTTGSMLTYRLSSSCVGDGKVEILASFDSGDWQTISTPFVNLASWSDSWSTHSVFLGNNAGKTARFRIKVSRTGGGYWFDRRLLFDDFICSDVILPSTILNATVAPESRSYGICGLEAGRLIGISVRPLFDASAGIVSPSLFTRIGGSARIPHPAADDDITYAITDMVYAAGAPGWSLRGTADTNSSIKAFNAWTGGFDVSLTGTITDQSVLSFSWYEVGYYGTTTDYDVISATYVVDDIEEIQFWSITNRSQLAERQLVEIPLSRFAGKSGVLKLSFGHYGANWTQESDIMRFYSPRISNVSVPVLPEPRWKAESYATCPAPQILSVKGRDDTEIDEGIYRELGIGEDTLRVKCSPSVTTLKAYPSHLTYLADEDITVEESGPNEFLLKMDTSKAPRRQRMILTLEAKNSNGDAVYRDLSIRFDEPKAVAQSDRWRKMASSPEIGKPVAAYTFDNSDTSNSGTGDFGLYVSSDNVTYEDSPLGRSVNNKTSDGPWENWEPNLTNEWTILTIAKTSDTNNGVLFAVGVTWKCGFALVAKDENTVKVAHWTGGTKQGEITATVPDATNKFHAYAIRGNGVNAELYVDGQKAGEFTTKGIPDFGFKMFGVYGGANYVGLANGSGEAIDDWRMYYSALPDSAIAAYTATLMQFDDDPAGVAVEEGGTVVPERWFAKYRPGQTITRAQLLAPAANGRSVWECYVAGLDPNDEDDDLVPEISFEGGVPKVSIANGRKASRQYRIWGRKSLSPAEAPVDVTDVEDLSADGYEDLRFFHISVELP